MAKGSVSKQPDGKWWARAPASTEGHRASLGLFAAEADAHTALVEYAISMHSKSEASRHGLTFRKFGEKVLDERELDGIRSVKSERNRFKKHLATSAIADLPVDAITSADISQLGRALSRTKASDGRGDRKLARGTVLRCLALVSVVFSEAVESNKRANNPCVGVRLKGRNEEVPDADNEETFGYLTVDEQKRVWTCKEIPEWARCLLAFAWGTGLRQGEQWNLVLSDLHVAPDEDPYVFVRWGSKGLSPKNGHSRRVPLFGLALVAAKRWLKIHSLYAPKNPLGLMWPSPKGCVRSSGAPDKSVRVKDANGKSTQVKVELMDGWLSAAGITRHIRWHDLRHTCASSLVTGAWGRTWTLEEVKEMLGHSSIIVTQRYAHLGETSLKKAAKETSGVGYFLASPSGPSASGLAAITSDFNEVGRAGLEPATYGLKEREQLEELRRVSLASSQELAQSGADLLKLIEDGSPFAMVRAAVLAAKLKNGVANVSTVDAD